MRTALAIGERRAGPATRAYAGLSVLLATACTGGGVQNSLDPRGPQAERIAEWFWVSLILGALIFLTYVASLLLGLRRAALRQRRSQRNELSTKQAWGIVIWAGVVVPALVLFGLLVFSAYTDRRLSRMGRMTGEDQVTIKVVGHQFWWEVHYRDPLRPEREFATANELHIPVGRPVRVLLESRDVIHSFWVPNLHGKADLIPGHTTDLVIQADQPGVFRGQCAEFCGVQHAKMGLVVAALEEAEFAAWWDAQLRPHGPPADSVAAAGEQIFMRSGCGVCHAIRGTDAHGTVAPDLSHFASRRTIAAGVLPNRRGHLAGWIADPQGIKPGNHMPAVPLTGEELRSVLSYLHSLE